ncbi:MAG: RNA polymerase sigma factor [Salinivirgaceae bacterium]|nr:RNA polymerase sigma factor [Salinivirgaceae bacterium]MDD4746858.1 RNA polymerase sigma factor [Salinivirgaceae bacterium]MDY0279077.1 RNA polymerase sigma factor [Salinivirgaceae bacterium]
MTTMEFSTQLTELQDNLGRFAYKLTANRDDALDLVQETLFKALKNQDKFEDKTNIKSWAFTIMKNTFINNYRRNSRTRIIVDQTKDAYYISKPQDSGFISPDSNFSVKEIRKAIAMLDDDYRIPFIMHTEGFKYKEIADEINIPIGSVKSRIFIARRKLMLHLKDYL